MTATVVEPGNAYALRLIRDSRHRSAAAALPVSQWLRWLEARGLATGSIDAYERRVALLLRLYPSTPLEEFTDQQLTTALTRVSKLVRRDYVTAYVSLFRTWAHARDLIPKDPTKLLGELRGTKTKYQETFTDAEVETLIGLPGENGLRFMLMFDTGLRISELCNLRVRDVQTSRGQLVVLRGKGDKDRVVPLTARLIQAFETWALLEAVTPAEYVFGHRKGGPQPGIAHRRSPLTPDAFRNWFYPVLDQHLPESRLWKLNDDGDLVRLLRPHATRHTFATMLIRRNAPIAKVSKFLGHKSPETTFSQYTHLVTDDLRDVIGLLEQ